MLNVISKQVKAIGISPLIYEVERNRIQELMDGTHPLSPKRKTYDTGTKRKTVLDQSPAGPAEIPESADDRYSHSNVGSGYNKGPDPGGRADDETGPGNTSDADPEQDFSSADNIEIAFLSESDTSSKWSPLNYESNERDRLSTNHLRKMYQRPGVGPMPVRHNVDRLIQNRVANSSWTYKFSAKDS